jgi:hypothetical protein
MKQAKEIYDLLYNYSLNRNFDFSKESIIHLKNKCLLWFWLSTSEKKPRCTFYNINGYECSYETPIDLDDEEECINTIKYTIDVIGYDHLSIKIQEFLIKNL